MKQILIITMAVFIAGCSVPYDMVKQSTDRCIEKGGQPIVVLWGDRTVKVVRCEIGGAIYGMDDY